MAATKPRKLDYVPLAELIPALVNPKEHDGDGIAGSIGRFGFLEVPVLDERTGRLVAGHGRADDLRRRQEAGETPPEGIVVANGDWLVPTVRGWRSENDDEAHAAGIALNRIGERGGWKHDELAEVLQVLDASALGLEGIGYERLDIDELLESLVMPLDLDEMGAKYGEPKEESLWPVIRLQVPQELYDRYHGLLAALGSGSEIERFAMVLDVAEHALALDQ